MEKVRAVVKEIAYAENHAKLSPLKRSVIIPVLSFASSLYTLALSLRHSLYRFRLLRSHRLAVPVISVGNLTWGGNGKTPMVEFIARFLAGSGIPPLILTRVRYKYRSFFLCFEIWGWWVFINFPCFMAFSLFWNLGMMGVYKFSIFNCLFSVLKFGHDGFFFIYFFIYFVFILIFHLSLFFFFSVLKFG